MKKLKTIQLMTIKQFCLAVNISRQTVYNMFDNGTLTAYIAPPRKGRYINPAEVLYLITDQPEKLKLKNETNKI